MRLSAATGVGTVRGHRSLIIAPARVSPAALYVLLLERLGSSRTTRYCNVTADDARLVII